MEIVRRIYDAVARGDNATVLAAYDTEVEFDFSRSPFREVLDRPIFTALRACGASTASGMRHGRRWPITWRS